MKHLVLLVLSVLLGLARPGAAQPRTAPGGPVETAADLQTALAKGGHITIAGANSPASLASRPIRVATGSMPPGPINTVLR